MARLGTLLVLMCAVGCAVRVYSPPSGGIPVESSATVGEGKTSVRADVSVGGATFGPNLSTYRVSVSRALKHNLDVSASPSLIWVHGHRREDSHPGIYGARAGVKYAPVRHLGLGSGLGVGASAAGAYVSPDLGAIAAFENDYVVPFAGARGFVSVPLGARYVHFTTGDDAADGASDGDSARDRYRLKPKLSFGYQVSLGIRVPLVWRHDAAVRPSLACAAGVTALFDGFGKHDRDAYSALACALDVVF